jgi:parallel beta-helix repeat protein
MNLFELEKRKKKLIELIEDTKRKKKKILQITNNLVSDYSKGKITRTKLHFLLNESLDNKSSEEWIRYYEDYLAYYDYQLKLCEKLIKEGKKKDSKKYINELGLHFLVVLCFIIIGILLISSFFIFGPTVYEKTSQIFSERQTLDLELEEDFDYELAQSKPRVVSSLDFEEEEIQYQAVVGEKVKWEKRVLIEDSNFEVILPEGSENIQVKSEGEDVTNRLEIKEKNKFLFFGKGPIEIGVRKGITGNVVSENTGRIEYVIYYETAAPITEKRKINGREQFIVKGPDEIHYENVFSSSEIEEKVSLEDKNKLKFYEIRNEERIETKFNVYDSDENGLIDKIEWITPRLSEAIFELVIEISDAELLDENREFVENVFEIVKEKDDVWLEVPNEYYVRATFESLLDNSRDITLHAKGNGFVEVYEIGKNERLINFEINGEETYKEYLTELVGEQNQFDLKFLGDLSVDWIVDPFYDNGSLQQILYDCGDLTTANAVYTMNQSISGVSGNCFDIDANNITIDLNGYDIDGLVTGGTGINIQGHSGITIKNGGIFNFVYQILIQSGSNNVLNNLTLGTRDSTSIGVYLGSGSENNSINNNNFVKNDLGATGNPNTGIYIYSSSNNFIINNTISFKKDGILLYSNSNNNFIKNNTIVNMTVRGIYIAESFNASLIENTFKGNVKDVYVLEGDIGEYSFIGNGLEIENLTVGAIKFLNESLYANGNDLFEVIKIDSNNIFVNTTLAPGLNTSAEITLEGLIGLEDPKVMVDYNDDGEFEYCFAPECNVLDWNNPTIIFNVSHFTTYRAADLVDIFSPNINFTFPTPEIGIRNVSDIFVNVSSTDVGFGDNNISTFIDFDNSLVGWWRMDDIGNFSYQETADEIGEEVYDLNVNYTKPEGASRFSVWRFKHGNSENNDYNVSIPKECWDYHPDKLVFKISSVVNSLLGPHGLCFTGQEWKIITKTGKQAGPSGFFQLQDSPPYNKSIDGDWDTGLWVFPGGIYYSCDEGSNDACRSSLFYEEAMIWFIENSNENVLADYSGNKNFGNLINGANQTEGRMGKAMSFDNIDDYIEVPHSESLNMDDELTLQCWVKLNSYLQNSSTSLWSSSCIYKSAGPSPYNAVGYALIIQNGTGIPYFQIDNNNKSSHLVAASSQLSLNQWHNIIGTYNGSEMKIYINGALESSVPRNGSINNSNYSLYIGNSFNEYAVTPWYSYINGSIDDVMIFNRALSSEEVLGLYANSSSRYVGVNFTELRSRNYDFKAYTQDTEGNINETEEREVQVLVPYLYECANLNTPNAAYKLKNNLYIASGFCFNISANNVTLDLNGYNISSDGGGHGILFEDVNEGTVKNGFLYNVSNGFKFTSSSNILIVNNTYEKSEVGTAIGIWLINSDDNLILNNSLTSKEVSGEPQPDWKWGIYSYNSDNNAIFDNEIYSDKRGIFNQESDNIIKNNTFLKGYVEVLDSYAFDIVNNTFYDAETDYIIKDSSIQEYGFIGNSLEIENDYGILKFINESIYASGNILSRVIKITPNNVFINTTLDSGFNTIANISLKDISFFEPRVVVDDNDNGSFIDCPSSICSNITWKGDDAWFNVSHFTSYRISGGEGDAPNITWVENLGDVDPIKGERLQIGIKVSIFDEIGYSNIHPNNLKMNITNSDTSEVEEAWMCRLDSDSSGSVGNFTCFFWMEYWDPGWYWNISAYVENLQGKSASNNSQSFKYKFLWAINVSQADLRWGGLDLISTNVPSVDNPLVIDNIGNKDIEELNLTGRDLIGQEDSDYIFPVSDFSFNISDSCIGQNLINDTEIVIEGAEVLSGNPSSINTTEEIYFCLNKVTTTSAQDYKSPIGFPWEISILFVSLIIKNKKKKKQIKIPIGLFVQAKPLETLCGYLKEQGYGFREIGELLNRDETTIWTSYNNSKKQKLEFEVGSELFAPLDIFADRRLSILESLVSYLRYNGFRNKEIAKLINRDERVISNLYSRANKKVKIISYSEVKIPISVFENKKPLETLCGYLKEQGYGFREIGELLNRDETTIWTSLNQRKTINLIYEPTKVQISTKLFVDRRLSILENLVYYFKGEGLRNKEIAELIKRDERVISTLYCRVKKKLKLN